MTVKQVRPLDGTERRDYRPISSPFKATWSSTVELLERECRALNASVVVLQLGVREHEIRQDGWVHARANPYPPTAVVSFETPKAGPMRFECGRFSDWQDNVRAIALGMEALRKIERYGIAERGEQYRGWQALPPATAMGAPLTRDEAVLIIADLAEAPILEVSCDPQPFYRRAAKLHHPDQGGDPAIFATLQRAWEALGG